MGNIHVKLFEIWTSGSGGDVIYRKSLPKNDGSTTDGHNVHLTKTDHKSSPLALDSGELKTIV